MTTESRKAYLASISREEYKVRQQIAYMRGKMFEFKKNACESRELIKKLSAEQERLEKTKAKVNGIKVVIRALKKQLPMKVRQVRVHLSDGEKAGWLGCPCCGWVVTNLDFLTYCDQCGQKIREQCSD